MATLPISDERMAQLRDYAQRHGEDPASALDSVLEEYLSWERQDSKEAVEGILEGYEDLKAGRTQTLDDVFDEVRGKHGLSR